MKLSAGRPFFAGVAILALALTVFGAGAASATQSIQINVEAGAYEISSDPNGLSAIRMEGFRTSGLPGSPLLPRKILDVALPPDVDWESVSVSASDVEASPLDGPYDLAPAAPMATYTSEGERIVEWGEAGPIEDGKDTSIYGKEADYPASCVQTLTFSQMRKWKFVRIEFTPFAYNPVSRSLRVITSARIVVEYSLGGQNVSDVLLRDTAMDDLAMSRFVNFNQAHEWYRSDAPALSSDLPSITNYDYVIITTNAIEAGSSKLSNYVSHKESQGFSVLVVTEDDYGSLTGQTPNGTAEKIRQWLINNYASYGIDYVLLIGDPDPSSGNVPMKMCWPRLHESTYKESPTDYFYADLTGNWDLDGDTNFGEYSGDRGTGGIDLTAEVYVGRIPVYGTAYSMLDSILQKTMDYQNASGDLAWRNKILLPESFSDSSTDGAYLGESIMDDYMTAAGFTSHKMYQQGTCTSENNSAFSSDEELLGGATATHWAGTPYGMVTWWGHGSQYGAYISYDPYSCGQIFYYTNCSSLDNTKPAIVYQCSCLNGYPEYSSNLSYSLLKAGAVVAVGASRVSWYLIGWNGPTGLLSNSDLGYEMDGGMAQSSHVVGQALAIAKSTLNPNTAAKYMNAYDFNVYGDPQIHYSQAGSGNHDPVLSAGGVDPDYGKSSTTFTYSVHYYDEDGDSPSVKKVYIDGSDYVMSGSGSNSTYTYATSALSAGSHNYFFFFEDGNGGNDKDPESGTFSGPVVDDTAPSSSCTSPTYSVSSGITVSFSASDTGGSGLKNTKLYYKYQSGGWTYHSTQTGSSGSFSFTASDGEGIYYFQTVAEDNSGNVESGPAGSGDDSTTYDSTLPSSGCTCAPYATSPNIDVGFGASDSGGSGLKWTNLYYKYGSGSWTYHSHQTGPSGTFSFTASHGEGIYYFQTIAEDNAGNAESGPSGSGDDSTIYDVTAPSSSCTSPSFTNSAAMSVSFSGSDSGSGLNNTSLYYKFESGSWTYHSNKTGLSGTFSFTASSGAGTYYFQTIAQDNAGNTEAGPSGSGDDSTILDTTAPSSSCTSPEYGGTSGIAVSFTASDAGGSGIGHTELHYKYGSGGSWTYYASESGTSGSFSFVASSGEGTYYFQTIAEDGAGNRESGPSGGGDDSTIYDATAPSSSCASPQYSTQAEISVGFTASDSGGSGLDTTGLYYRLGSGGSWTYYDTQTGGSGTFSFVAPSGEGTYYFQTIAEDNAGNQEAGPSGDGDDSTIYDATAPQSSCTAPQYANSSPIVVSFTASDTPWSGVAEVALWYNFESQGWTDSGLFETGASGTIDFIPSDGDGTYEFYTIATDNAGNVESAPGTADDSTEYDTVAPQSSCTSPMYANSSPIVVSFTAVDSPSSGVAEVALWFNYEAQGWTDSGLFETGTSGTIDFVPSDGDGTYEFYTIATDNAGNEESAPGTADDSTEYDTVAPQSTCSTVEFANSSPIAVAFTALDSPSSGIAEVALWYNYESQGWTDSGLFETGTAGTIDFTPPDGDGTYEFYTIASDNAGNVESAPGAADDTTEYDTVAPQSSCTSPMYANSSPIVVSFTAVDSPSSGVAEVALWYNYESQGWVDSGLFETGTIGTIDFVPPEGDGTYEFYTVAMDNAGNTESAPGTADDSTEYDTVAPQSSCTSPMCANSSPILVSFTAVDSPSSGVAEVVLWYNYESQGWVDSGLFETSTSGTIDFIPWEGDGKYEFYTTATDNAGNVESAPGTADDSTEYDTVAPQSTCSTVEFANSSPIEVAFTALDSPSSGIAEVALWYNYEGQGWTDSGLFETGAIGAIDFVPPEGDGTYEFYTIATDNAGNVESAPATADDSTEYDTVVPQSSCTSPQFANFSPIVVEFTASDGQPSDEIEVALWYNYESQGWTDSGLIESATFGTIDFAPPEGDGSYEFYTIASDNAGNAESAPATPDSVTEYDTVAPESSCTSPMYANSSPIVVSFTAVDSPSSGIAEVALWYNYGEQGWADSGLFETGTFGTIDFTPTEGEGDYEFYTIATDKAGNVEAAPGSRDDSTTFDTTAPDSSCTSPTYANASPILVEFTVAYSGSSVASTELWYNFEQQGWLNSGLSETGSSGSFDFAPPDGDGTYQFYTISTDFAGNVEQAPATANDSTEYDTVAPESSCTSPQFAKSSPIAVAFTAIDSPSSGIAEVALWYNYGSQGWTNSGLTETGTSGTLYFAPPDGDGTYQFYTIATDKAGNAEAAPGTADDATEYDTAAPQSSCSSPTYANSSPVVVSFTASDSSPAGLDEVVLWYKHGSQGWTNSGLTESGTSGSFDFTPAQGNGTYQFYTIASDNAGNVESAPVSADDVTEYDTVAPQSSCTSPQFAVSSPIEVSFTASDSPSSGVSEVALWYKYESQSWAASGLTASGTSGGFDFVPPEGDGTYKFYTIATDNAGNSEAAPSGNGDSSTVFDTTAPASAATAPSQVSEAPFTVQFTASDAGSGVAVTRLKYRFNGGAWQSYGSPTAGNSGSFEFTAPQGEGAYNFYTIAADVAGNVETAPSTPDATTIYNVAEADIDVDTLALEFGDVEVSQSRTLVVVVTNVGDANLSITNLSCDEPELGAVLDGHSLPYSLAPEGSIDVLVTFTPASPGEVEGVLSISSSDPDEPVVTIDFDGTGIAAGELEMLISADGSHYEFGDDLVITVGAVNEGPTVQADVYVALAYDFGGPGERFWSPVGFDSWTEGIVPWLTDRDLPYGLDVSIPAWSLPVPSDVPNLALTGDYALFAAAAEPGTMDFISEIAAWGFSVEGAPFIRLDADASSYGPGDVLSMDLAVSAPAYDVLGDVYLAALRPDGSFYSLQAPSLVWQPGITPIIPAYVLPAGLRLSLEDFWQVQITVDSAPFNAFGDYYLFAGMTEGGTLTLWSDIGVAHFAIE